MAIVKRFAILFVLLSILIPTTVFPSGDGDIPESRLGLCTSGDSTMFEDWVGDLDLTGLTWLELWDLFVETLPAIP